MLNDMIRLFGTVLLFPRLAELALGAEFIFATQGATVGNRMVALRVPFKDSYGLMYSQGGLEVDQGSDPAVTDPTTLTDHVFARSFQKARLDDVMRQ